MSSHETAVFGIIFEIFEFFDSLHSTTAILCLAIKVLSGTLKRDHGQI